MKNKNYGKYLVIGIMTLFVGASIIPVISGGNGNSTNFKDIDSEKIGVDQKIQINPNGEISPSGWNTKTTELVSTQSNKPAYNVDIVIDDYMTLHTAWVDRTQYGPVDTDYDIFYKSRSSTGIWSNTEVISTESTDQANASVTLAVEDRGGGIVRVHAAWVDYSDYNGCGPGSNIFYKYRDPTGWSVTEVVSTESDKYVSHPSMAIDNNNAIVHIAWADYSNVSNNDNDGDIFYKCKPSGGSWPLVTEVVSTDSPGLSGAPSLDLGGSGTQVHIAWHEKTDATYYDIFYKNKINGIWSPTEFVSTESKRFAEYPSLAVDQKDNTVHVAWMDTTKYHDPVIDKNSGGEWDIFYKYRNSTSGIWSPTELVSWEGSGDSAYPSIDTDSFSRVHIAWHDDSSYFIPNNGTDYLDTCGPDADIFYKSKPRTCDGWWMYANVVSSESDYDSEIPCLKIDANDSINIAWHDLTNFSGHNDLYWDIVYKLGAGTIYYISGPNSILLKGRGFLNCANGIFDIDLKDGLAVLLHYSPGFYLLLGNHRVSSNNIDHRPNEFSYSHGRFTTPLPSNIDYIEASCGPVVIGKKGFLGFFSLGSVPAGFSLQGISYP